MIHDEDIVEKLRLLRKQHSSKQSGMNVMQHYHLCHKHVPNYSGIVRNNLQRTIDSSDADCFMVLCDYIVYLISFQPEYALAFQHERLQYIKQALEVRHISAPARKMVARLIVGEFPQILNALKGEISKGLDQNNEDIEALFNIIECKLQWEYDKQQISVFYQSLYLNQLKSELMELICESNSNKKQLILRCKMRLMTKIIKHLPEDGLNTHNYQKRIVQFIENCVRTAILTEQTRSQLFKLVTDTIDRFGAFNVQQLSKFISENLRSAHSMNNLPFLFMTKTFLEKLTKKTKIAKEFLLSILKRLYECLFDRIQTNLKSIYEIKKTMTEMIIRISSLSKIQFSKQISLLLHQTNNPNYSIVLVSLLFLYQQKMNADVVSSFGNDIDSFFNQKTKYADYKNIIDLYASDRIVLEQYRIRDSEQQGNLMWNLLAIRNTLLIDPNELLEQDKIYGLLNNLIKLAILDILPEQCLDVIELMMQRFGLLRRSQMQRVSLVGILRSVDERFKEYLMPIEVIEYFKKIIVWIGEKVELVQFRNTSLMLQLVIIMHRNCSRDELSLLFYDSLTSLVALSIPKAMSQQNVDDLQQIIPLMAEIVQRQPNFFTLNLFLSLMHRTLKIQEVRELYLSFENQLRVVVHEHEEIGSLLISLDLHMYIMAKGSFQEYYVQQLWKCLQQTPNLHQNQTAYHFLTLFEYFLSILTGETLRSFCVRQATHTMQFISFLDNLRQNRILIYQIQGILKLKYSYLMYLYELIAKYSKIAASQPCTQLKQILNKLTSMCLKIKSQEWMLLAKEKRMQGIRNACENNNFVMHLIIPILMKINPSNDPGQDRGLIDMLEDDFEWMRNYTNNEESFNRSYLRLIRCISAL